MSKSKITNETFLIFVPNDIFSYYEALTSKGILSWTNHVDIEKFGLAEVIQRTLPKRKNVFFSQNQLNQKIVISICFFFQRMFPFWGYFSKLCLAEKAPTIIFLFANFKFFNYNYGKLNAINKLSFLTVFK